MKQLKRAGCCAWLFRAEADGFRSVPLRPAVARGRTPAVQRAQVGEEQTPAHARLPLRSAQGLHQSEEQGSRDLSREHSLVYLGAMSLPETSLPESNKIKP